MMGKTICYLLFAAILFSSCENKPIPAKELAGVPAEDTTTIFQYEPAVSVLHGTLYIATYERIPENTDGEELSALDTASLDVEREQIILLNKPITVLEDTAEEMNEAQTGITKVQIAPTIDATQYLNRKVKVTGKLWGAQTGHHHTPVLITVDKIEAQ